MKKLFCIISASIIAVVGTFLTTLCFVKTSAMTFDKPFSINVYYKNTTPVNGNSSLYEEDKEFAEIMKNLAKAVKSSFTTRMIFDGDLDNKPVYGGTDYSNYDTSMKKDNLVVELIYRQTKDAICYENGNSRIISYSCLIIVIPCVEKYNKMIVYSSINNDSTLKEEEYRKSTPFVIKGNPKKLLKYVDSLK